MSASDPVLRAENLIENLPRQLSRARKLVLLLMFCFAQCLDAFNNAALFPAIPTLESYMGITQGRSAWIISAFQLTFASFLLISGRISDVYNPKNVFITGVLLLGILSLCSGFVNNPTAFIVLRAFMGIGAAMSIPSALTLLVHIFPEPLEQARALAVLGGCGAVSDVLGLFIGAVLVQHASCHWVFWFVAIIAIPISLGCVFIIPAEIAKSKDSSDASSADWKNLDLIGVTILTVAFILFIYATTSGSADRWTTARVLTPLISSVLLFAMFFYWETLVPASQAAIPPRTWFYNNFSVLFCSALLPFFWWNANFLVFTTLWQDVFHWSIVSTAVHMFPLGVAAMMMSFTGPLSRIINPKWIILTGLSMVAGATVLLAVGGSRPDYYWRYIFPAFTLGSAGTMLTYNHTNIAIFRAAPASMAGTVGAIFNGALQFGSAFGIATFTSIETSLESRHGGSREYYGRAAAFWFLLGIVSIEIISVAYFYRRGTEHGAQPDENHDSGEKVKETNKAKSEALLNKDGRVYRVSLVLPDYAPSDTT